ncbi:carboxylesterase family protein [Jatrophihabitans sp.]|uniref:carboxylesterase/lipase family protein n=1 Tax=Jatrophihabitans sp. TaxID=1932789 RepID=UPI0030C70562
MHAEVSDGEPVEVGIAQGIFRGRAAGGVSWFKGIPYAAAPVGPNRFAAPAPPPRHDGVADAADYGPTVSTPPQRSPVMDALLPDPVRPGVNGLNLNVWTPDVTGRLPVLVWLHGGGFATGAGSTTAFDGTAFAHHGVVTVTLNYRLAVEGFLRLPGAPSNRGLLDQIAALEWIRDNIEHFGGDPARVTVAGESAGAMSVLTLLAMPRTKGLIRRAISQSGDGHHVHPVELADAVAAELCAELGIDRTVAAIAAVPLPLLHAATNVVLNRFTGGADPRYPQLRRLILQPVIDGDTLLEHPVAAARRGISAGVELLIGTNSDEYALFVATTGMADMGEDTLLDSTARLGVDAPAMVAAYRAQLPDADPAELFVAIQSDWFCRVPTIRFVEARALAAADSHVYEFAWRPPTYGGRLGACHTLEIPFVFDTLADPWGRALRGDAAPQSLANEVHTAWASFVRSGDPGWPPYGSQRILRRFDLQSATITDPDVTRREAWAGIL